MNEIILRNTIKQIIVTEILGHGVHSHRKVKEQLDKLRWAKDVLRNKLYSISDKATQNKLKDALEKINDGINGLSKYENDWI